MPVVRCAESSSRSLSWRVLTVALTMCLGTGLIATGAASAAPAQSDGTRMLVVGDSYSSGEGLEPYDAGTDTDNKGCHRSSQAYGPRAAERMTGVSVSSVACSGAVISDYAEEQDPGVPAQSSAVRTENPDYVVLSMGGNDAEWSKVIKACASGVILAGLDDPADCKQRLDTGEATVDSIAERLGGLYDSILTDAPAAQVKVLLYPPMFPTTTDSDGRCVLYRKGPVDITISRETTARMVALQDRLNSAIIAKIGQMQAADVRAASRLGYVDTVAPFGGHDGHTITCGRKNRPTPWINSIEVEGTDLQPRSLHPTAQGQRVMGDALASSFSVSSPLAQPQQAAADRGAAIAAARRGTGYWRASPGGGVVGFGDAAQHGNVDGTALAAPVVGMAATPSDLGYWLVAADGGVFAFGDAPFEGAATGTTTEAATGIAAVPNGTGYRVVFSNGDVRSFGGAADAGNATDRGLLASVVGIASTRSGVGYWLVTGDGDVLPFGDANPLGSMSGRPLNAPVVGIAPTPSGAGYWLVAADGGVFAFGDATFSGSTADADLQGPVVGIAPTPSGAGYWLTAEDGGVFAFGDAPFLGR